MRQVERLVRVVRWCGGSGGAAIRWDGVAAGRSCAGSGARYRGVDGVLRYESGLRDIGKECGRTPGEGISLNYETLLDSDDVDDDVLYTITLVHQYVQEIQRGETLTVVLRTRSKRATESMGLCISGLILA